MNRTIGWTVETIAILVAKRDLLPSDFAIAIGAELRRDAEHAYDADADGLLYLAHYYDGKGVAR
jgi:hypothetical protein